MDPKTFHLTIITPERIVFDGAVRSIIAPGGAGSLGALVDHAPLITTLLPGRLDVTASDGTPQSFFIGPGFLDILRNQATLVTESVQKDRPTKLS
ncbi:MAG TPA: F0F1 ATP synthase subunit epsilon [Candidatus Manganitrophaceae bacterium]|nr:F0F1 ATP synthase subunit epsilon [Candidatus Manganitrophaceae bacterium]